jgi:glycosyltransferase involved in cell wall biosynthesis
MKILVIAPQPFFSPRGTPFSVYYRTLISAEQGAQIDLLTYGEGQNVDIPGVRIIRIPHFPGLGPVKIGPSPLKLFLDLFIVLWTIGLLLRSRYDLVHAHEEAVFFCRFLKPLFGFKLLYDMHSSLPQQLNNFEFSDSKFLLHLFERLENTCLRAADAVITICPDLANYVRKNIKDHHKHFMIENSLFEPVRLASTGNGSGAGAAPTPVSMVDLPTAKRWVVYAGTLEAYQGIDLLVASFAQVVKRVPDAGLLIVGGTKQQVTRYQALSRQHGVADHVVFTGRVPQQTAQRYSHMAAVQISPRSSGTNTPLKVYEQLASGVPLVATRIYSHTQVLDDQVAMLVEPDPASIAEGIIALLQSEQKARTLAEQARALYDREYARPIYTRKIKNVMEFVSPCAE